MDLVTKLQSPIQKKFACFEGCGAARYSTEEKSVFIDLILEFNDKKNFPEIIRTIDVSSIMFNRIADYIAMSPRKYFNREMGIQISNLAKIFCRLKESDANREKMWKIVIKIVNKMLTYKSVEATRSVVILYFRPVEDLDVELVVNYLNDVYEFLLTRESNEIENWFKLLFDVVFPLFLHFPLTNFLDPASQPHIPRKAPGWTKESAKKVVKNLENFYEKLYQKADLTYDAFSSDSKNVTYGIIYFMKNLSGMSLVNFINYNFHANIACSDENFVEKYKKSPFLPAAYTCTFNGNSILDIQNVIKQVDAEYLSIFLISFVSAFAFMQSVSSEKAIEQLIICREVWTIIFSSEKANDQLLSYSFYNITSFVLPKYILLPFLMLFDSKFIKRETLKIIWTPNLPDAESMLSIARALTVVFFPDLMNIDIKKLVEYSDKYIFKLEKTRDVSLIPFFLEYLDEFDKNPCIYAAKVFPEDFIPHDFFIPYINRLNYSSDEIMELMKNMFQLAFEYKAEAFNNEVVQVYVKIARNIPPKFKYDSTFLYEVILPELFKRSDSLFVFHMLLDIFGAGIKISDEYWAKFKELFKKYLLNNDRFYYSAPLFFAASNIELLESIFSDLQIEVFEALKKACIEQWVTEETRLLSSLLISLYTLFSLKDDEWKQNRAKPLMYLDALCMKNRANHLVAEQVIAHLLVIYDPPCSMAVNTDTLFAQVEGAPISSLNYMHALFSDETDTSTVFPDLPERALVSLIPLMKGKIKDEYFAAYAALCVDAVRKKPSLLAEFERGINDCIVKQQSIDTILAGLYPSNYSIPKNIDAANPVFALDDNKFTVITMKKDGFTATTKQAYITKTFEYKIEDAPQVKRRQKPAKKSKKNAKIFSGTGFSPEFTDICKGITPTFTLDTEFPKPDFPPLKFAKVKLNEVQSDDSSSSANEEGTQRKEGNVKKEDDDSDDTNNGKDKKNKRQEPSLPPGDAGAVFGAIAYLPSNIKNSSKAVLRNSRVPFEMSTRTVSKIGLLYVKNGVLAQNEILSATMDDTSHEFRAFLQSLGRVVNLKNFDGYTGKLDCTRFSNGTHSIYFSDARIEAMFHVAPMMPTVAKDTQQILKKRHIGNDNVHIIWNEDYNTAYNTSTIISQFNDAHVIISPRISKGLFEISLRKKVDSYDTGPVYGKIFASQKTLGVLSRWSAILSDISIRNLESPLATPHNKFNMHLRRITVTPD